jgi:hypothetical protein
VHFAGKPIRRFSVGLIGTFATIAGYAGCTGCNDASRTVDRGVQCPEEVVAPHMLPRQKAEHRSWRYWAAKYSGKAKEPLLSSGDFQTQRAAVARIKNGLGWSAGRWNVMRRRITARTLRNYLEESVASLITRVRQNKRVLRGGTRPSKLIERYQRFVAAAQLVVPGEFRLAIRETPLGCYPSAKGLYARVGAKSAGKAVDPAFNLNQCSRIFPGEIVRVLYRANDRWWLVHTSYAEGWVQPPMLSAPLETMLAARFAAVQGPSSMPLSVGKRYSSMTFDADSVPLEDFAGKIIGYGRIGLVLPRAPLFRYESVFDRWLSKPVSPWAWFPGERGLVRVRRRADHVRPTGIIPLTRHALFRRAFALLDQPYGWGGRGGHRDCSRYMMDLFNGFDVQLPRNSLRQSVAGAENIDVSSFSETQKRRAIRKAAKRGAVLLYMKGHIALYLGSDTVAGQQFDFAIHALYGYLTRCEGVRETLNRIDRVAITSLDLGRGSSRKSYLQRIQTLVVIGKPGISVGMTK